MARGAREKLTQDGIRTALRLCKCGLPDCQIASALGVTASTFSGWRNHPKTKNQTQLSKAMKKADAEREAALVTRIMRASDDSWQAAAWLLERRYPDRYAKPVRPVEDKSAERDDERIKGYIDALGLR